MATIAEIAKAAKVSAMTVSRVLNTDTEYQRPTYAKRAVKIRDLAKKMGYRPNASAMAMRSGRFDCVALLLSADRQWSLLPDAMLAGIQSALDSHNMHLAVGSFSDAILTNEHEVPKLLRHLSSDGMLINYNAAIPETMVRLFQTFRLPSIWINSKHSQNAVHADDLAASVSATGYLLKLRHRRIAYLNYNSEPDLPDAHYSFTDRWDGYHATMVAAGQHPYRFGSPDWRRAGNIVNSLRELFQRPVRPTGVVAYGLMEARAALAAAGLASLRVPEDLSIITFAERATDDMGPMLTTCVLPEEQIGRQAVDLLLNKITNPESSVESAVIPFGFDPGATCAPMNPSPQPD